MTNTAIDTTGSNVVRLDAAAAIKLVRSACNSEHTSHSNLAYAVAAIVEQAYTGNLTPAMHVAAHASDPARKAINAVGQYFTNGDLKIVAKTEKFKGASLKKGWNDRRLEWDIVGLSEAIVESCPLKKGMPDLNRASIYRLAKSLKPATPPTVVDLNVIETRTIKAITKLALPGVDGDTIKALIHEAISKIGSASRQTVAAHNAKIKADEAAKPARKTRK